MGLWSIFPSSSFLYVMLDYLTLFDGTFKCHYDILYEDLIDVHMIKMNYSQKCTTPSYRASSLAYVFVLGFTSNTTY